MRVLFLTIGDEDCASSMYRIYQYGPVLREEGIEATILPPEPVASGLKRPLSKRREERRILRQAAEHDVVVIQKRLFGRSFLRSLALLGKPVVFDFDDAIYTSSGGEYSWWTGRRVLARLRAVLSFSRVVLAGNVHLADFASEYAENVEIVPTAVDLDRYKIKDHSEREVCVVGWMGSHATQKYLKIVEPAIRNLARTRALKFVVVSNRSYNLDGVDVEFREWSREREIEDLLTFDIGLMPLEDNEWEQGKCAFKAIQYGACGIPAVCTPVGMAADVVIEGENGNLCETVPEWEEAISNLADDAGLRSRYGRAGRKRVERYYSNERVGEHWCDLLKTLCPR